MLLMPLQVPMLRRIAAAHTMHHMDKFGGVPFGLFLGPQELAAVGGQSDLEHQIQRRIQLEGKQDAVHATA